MLPVTLLTRSTRPSGGSAEETVEALSRAINPHALIRTDATGLPESIWISGN